jgi:aminoglycoside phosphotransferase (APT) family kinase protein
MIKKYFDLSDDFESIIFNNLVGVLEIAKIPTGWTNYVFVATTKNGKYVFRFPRNNFFSEALEKEIDFNRFIRNKIAVKTPNLQKKLAGGRPYSMHKMIAGSVLTEIYNKLTLDEKKQLASDIADYLVALQKIKPTKFKLEPVSIFLTNLAKVNNADYNYSILNPLKEMEKRAVLSHGDFNPGNIILGNNRRLLAVLDYAFVSYSCPENDLSRVIGRLPKDFRDIMIHAYELKSYTTIHNLDIDKLIYIWKYVEEDYIDYMRKCHPDVILPNI